MTYNKSMDYFDKNANGHVADNLRENALLQGAPP